MIVGLRGQSLHAQEGLIWSEASVEGMVYMNWCILYQQLFQHKWYSTNSIHKGK